MMRTVVTTLAVLVIACSGGDHDNGPKLGNNDVAGSVVSLEGKVTARVATTNASTRTLRAGDPVMAGDVVTTAEDATIKIRFDHNGAELALGGDKTIGLRQTAAWRAKPATAGALDKKGDTKTSVAGRHTEKEAADTRATTLGADKASAEPVPVEVADKAPVDVADKAPVDSKPPPPDKKIDIKRDPRPKTDKSPTDGTGGGPKITVGSKGDGDDKTDGETKNSPKDLKQKSGKLSVSDVKKAMSNVRGKLMACAKPPPAEKVKVKLRITVKPSGKVSAVVASNAPNADVAACLERTAKKAVFPRTQQGKTFSFTVILRP